MGEFIIYGGMAATRGEVLIYSRDVYLNNALLAGATQREAEQAANKWSDVAAFGFNTQQLTSEEVEWLTENGLRFDPKTGEPVGWAESHAEAADVVMV
jgi:hypothetical protein